MLRLPELAAVVGGVVVCQRLVYLFGRYAEVQSHGDGSAQVGNVVCSNELCAHAVPRFIYILAPLDMQEGRTALYPCLHVGDSLTAHHESPFLGHLAQIVVQRIQENLSATPAQVVIEFAFGALHALKRAEPKQVRPSHIGDESVVGLHQRAQETYLSGMIGSRLHHRQVVFVGQTKQCAGYSYVVVQVALGV